MKLPVTRYVMMLINSGSSTRENSEYVYMHALLQQPLISSIDLSNKQQLEARLESPILFKYSRDEALA